MALTVLFIRQTRFSLDERLRQRTAKGARPA